MTKKQLIVQALAVLCISPVIIGFVFFHWVLGGADHASL